jgi:putative transposase
MYPVDLQCKTLNVARSGFYRWLRAPVSPKQLADDALVLKIKAVFEGSDSRYGSPCIQETLRAGGESCGRRRVARLMREHKIVSRTHKAFRSTTNSEHAHPIADNVLARQFGVGGTLNSVWTSDITCIGTSEGWLYLATVMDIASRRIVGWSMSGRIDQKLVEGALLGAVAARRPGRGLVLHSDRGITYARESYRKLLAGYGIAQSMSRKANCWDNAPMESFFHSLKGESIKGRIIRTRAQARSIVFEYIEIWYNQQRLHSTLGYQSPAAYERGLAAERQRVHKNEGRSILRRAQNDNDVAP